MDALLTILAYVVWFLATFFLLFFLLLLYTGANQFRETKPMARGWRPAVTVIVAAYNEEGKIGKTIASLKRIAYAKLEFIIVNDGSHDGTAAEAREAIGNDLRFRLIDRKKNIGKAASLNEGISHARGEFIATMDADSMVEPRVFQKTLGYFADKKVGAVTISVAVHEPQSILHKMIDIEYLISLSVMLKALSFINCAFVTPGPFSVYRKSVLDEIHGFDAQNIVEDLEIAYRIHKAGYSIATAREAFVHTIVPPTFKQIYVQRRRWYSGAVQTLVQHRKMLFRDKYGTFGYFMPFQFTLTVLGLLLFALATYVGAINFATFVSGYQYTGYNFFHKFFEDFFKFDALRIKSITIIGFLSLIASLTMIIVGLRMTRARVKGRLAGILAYPLFFFLYQIFWIGAFIAVLRGKKISWR